MGEAAQRSVEDIGGGGAEEGWSAAFSHLISERVSADGDGLRPAGNQPRNVLADDWLTEDGAAQDVSDGTVRALPHLLQAKFYEVKRKTPHVNLNKVHCWLELVDMHLKV